jgi:lipopolysaccharide export system permease protein
MRLLDRYLLRELLIPFGYCLSGFLIFWISFDLINDMSTFQRARLKPLEIAMYYAVKTPADLVFPMLPAAWLLALLYAMVHHARHNELVAMRAAGVSIWRMALPYLMLGLLLSGALFAINEFWAPDSTERAEAILKKRQVAKSPAKQWARNVTFSNGRANRTWVIEAYDREKAIMIRPHVKWTLATGSLCEINAERAVRTNDVWVFLKVKELTYLPIPGAVPMPEFKDIRPIPEFTETPDEIESEIKIGNIQSLRDIRKAQLSLMEIIRYKRLHPEDSKTMDMLNTKLHGRLAAPWTCFVIVLIALPFGAMTGRRNVFAGVASSIVICFAYFVLLQMGLALGSGGLVYPWVAAWAPNFLFSLGGIIATWRLR